MQKLKKLWFAIAVLLVAIFSGIGSSVDLIVRNGKTYGTASVIVAGSSKEEPSLFASDEDVRYRWTNDAGLGMVAELTYGGVLTISGTNSIGAGKEWNEYSRPIWSMRDPAGINEVIIEEGVTAIGDYSFYGLKNLKKVTIANSVGSIGARAFEACVSLTTIDIPKGVYSIGDHAFGNCVMLKTVNFSDNLQKIEAGAFYHTGLEKVVLPDSLITLSTLYTNNKNTGAFEKCQSLETVQIGDHLEIISENTFAECIKLKSIVLGSNVVAVKNNAFANCNELKTVYYCGNGREQSDIWDNNVTRGEGNESLDNATVFYFREAMPFSLTANYWHWKDEKPTVWHATAKAVIGFANDLVDAELEKLRKTQEQFKQVIDDTIAMTTKTVMAINDAVYNAINAGVHAVVNLIKNINDMIMGAIKGVSEMVAKTVKAVVGAILKTIQFGVNAVKSVVNAALEAVYNTIHSMVEFVTSEEMSDFVIMSALGGFMAMSFIAEILYTGGELEGFLMAAAEGIVEVIVQTTHIDRTVVETIAMIVVAGTYAIIEAFHNSIYAGVIGYNISDELVIA